VLERGFGRGSSTSRGDFVLERGFGRGSSTRKAVFVHGKGGVAKAKGSASLLMELGAAFEL
jgi:hypothetical protein